ncbi:MAG: C2H2-type zinc finger protein [Candidatus Micrarchaeota archaeon]|nr:C2H2-type zinc finger protein [Candidatus Micrarchaeota archaeon]
MPRFECAVCGTSFSSGDELANHIKSAHGSATTAPTFECSICNQMFNDEASLVSHMSGAHPKS